MKSLKEKILESNFYTEKDVFNMLFNKNVIINKESYYHVIPNKGVVRVSDHLPEMINFEVHNSENHNKKIYLVLVVGGEFSNFPNDIDKTHRKIEKWISNISSIKYEDWGIDYEVVDLDSTENIETQIDYIKRRMKLFFR